MLPRLHPDHFAFRSVEAILSEYVGQDHPIAQHRFPFSFNVEDQYSQGQTTLPRKTQGDHQLGEPSRARPEPEKPNVRARISDPLQGYLSTEPAIDLLGSLQRDQHGERKPPIPSHLPPPQLLQKASANPTPPNALSSWNVAPKGADSHGKL